MRYLGRFFAPVRIIRITTDMRTLLLRGTPLRGFPDERRRRPSAPSPTQPGESARAVPHALDHGPGLIEVPEQLIDLGNGGAASRGDAAAAAAVEDTRAQALAGRHARQNRLEALHPPRIGCGLLERR